MSKLPPTLTVRPSRAGAAAVATKRARDARRAGRTTRMVSHPWGDGGTMRVLWMTAVRMATGIQQPGVAPSRQRPLDDLAAVVGQPLVAAVVAEGQPLVV